MIVYDLEADGLDIQDISKIHCIAISDLQTGELVSYHGSTLEKAVLRISESPNIAHNQLEYDMWVIKKFFPWFKANSHSIDTLVMSTIIPLHFISA